MSEEITKYKYRVLRDGVRISDEVLSYDEAIVEQNRWLNILKKWPDGTKITIEPCE